MNGRVLSCLSLYVEAGPCVYLRSWPGPVYTSGLGRICVHLRSWLSPSVYLKSWPGPCVHLRSSPGSYVFFRSWQGPCVYLRSWPGLFRWRVVLVYTSDPLLKGYHHRIPSTCKKSSKCFCFRSIYHIFLLFFMKS